MARKRPAIFFANVPQEGVPVPERYRYEVRLSSSNPALIVEQDWGMGRDATISFKWYTFFKSVIPTRSYKHDAHRGYVFVSRARIAMDIVTRIFGP